ncbi:MAG: hypothetical protein KF771_00960 [Burkholderiales bacterium]|nr:hypothetical protein [Burkholderiales bacterium]
MQESVERYIQGLASPSGLHGVSIKLSDCITLVLVITESGIVPIHVGSHDEVY